MWTCQIPILVTRNLSWYCCCYRYVRVSFVLALDVTCSISSTLPQSLVLPLQGFLNAIVYGWTNEDFVDTVIKSSSSDSDTSVSSQRGRPSYLHRDQSTSELVYSEDVASEHH